MLLFVMRKKLVIVGDGVCGKICFLFVFFRDEFFEIYVLIVFDIYVVDMEVDGKMIELVFWDIVG